MIRLMKKTINENYRLEVRPGTWYSKDHKRSVAILSDIKESIERHVDDVASAEMEWDMKEICEFCKYEWELDDDGLPMCCQKAVKEAVCENHLTELSGDKNAIRR